MESVIESVIMRDVTMMKGIVKNVRRDALRGGLEIRYVIRNVIMKHVSLIWETVKSAHLDVMKDG
jgi:hypothetical protein